MSVAIVRLASFNTGLLALPGVRFHDEAPYTEEEYAAKTAFIGSILERGQIDLVGFQEIFHEEALREAVACAPRFEQAYVTAPLADGSGPTSSSGALNAPRVGLASRLPVRRAETIRAFPPELGNSFGVRREPDGTLHGVPVDIRYFERPLLRAEVELPGGYTAIVYVTHLKSRRPVVLDGEDRDDPAVRVRAVVRSLFQRGAEAAALRLMLTQDMAQRGPGHPVILLGDLNDELSSVTTELVRGDQPLPESLRSLMNDPNSWQRKNRRLWDLHLYSAVDIQAGSMKGAALYTHIHFGDYQVLDHILISQEFYPRNPNRIGTLRYVQVYNDHVVDTHMTDQARGDRARSDHGVPVAELAIDLKPPVPEPAERDRRDIS